MRIVEQSYEILTPLEDITSAHTIIAAAARTCYKSEDKASPESDIRLVKSLIARSHDAMLEFADIRVKIICDRGVANELVRHRIASFAQESTRYCNYGKDKFGSEITVICPFIFNESPALYVTWEQAMHDAETTYMDLLDMGATPELARSVLPLCTKTEINIKTNIREWRNIFRMRCAKAAHPQIRELMTKLLAELKEITFLFDDINVE